MRIFLRLILILPLTSLLGQDIMVLNDKEQFDTICSNTLVNIPITTDVVSTNGAMFKYWVTDPSPFVTDYPSDTITGILPDTITNTLTNTVDYAIEIKYKIVAWLRDTGGNPTGEPDSIIAMIVVEPAPRIIYNETSEIICNNDSSDFLLTSPTQAIHGVSYRYYSEAENPAFVSGTKLPDPALIFPFDGNIRDKLTNKRNDTLHLNNSNTIQNVNFIITPLTLDAFGNEACSANNDTNVVRVLPQLYAVMESDTLRNGVEILCKGDATGGIKTNIYGGYNAVTGFIEEFNTYMWQEFDSTTRHITGLPAGTYHIEVEDIHGCYISDTKMLNEPDSFLTSSTCILDELTCSSSDLAIFKIEGFGGTRDYSVKWYEIQEGNPQGTWYANTFTVSTINEMKYRAFLTDDNGCLVVDSVTLVKGTGNLNVGILQSDEFYEGYDITCDGENDGFIQLDIPDASTRMFDYSLKGYDFVTGETIYNEIRINNNTINLWDSLSPGKYIFSIADTGECPFHLDPIYIIEPDPVVLNFDSISYYNDNMNISCNGLNDGFIHTTVTGGRTGEHAPDYFYRWETTEDTFVNAPNKNNLDSLVAGKYRLTVYQKFFNLITNEYIYCADSGSIELKEPDPVILKIDSVSYYNDSMNISCYGYDDGYIQAYASGGRTGEYTLDYFYRWETTDKKFVHSSIINKMDNLKAGKYKVTAYQKFYSPIQLDTVYCMDSDTIELKEPEKLDIDFFISTNDTSLKIDSVIGTFQWLDCNNNFSFIPGETEMTFSPSQSGNYSLQVNNKGCIDTSGCYNILITENIAFSKFKKSVSLCPNPVGDIINIKFENEQEFINVILKDITGKVLMEKQYYSTNIVPFNINKSPGYYFVTIQNNEGKYAIFKFLKK